MGKKKKERKKEQTTCLVHNSIIRSRATLRIVKLVHEEEGRGERTEHFAGTALAGRII